MRDVTGRNSLFLEVSDGMSHTILFSVLSQNGRPADVSWTDRAHIVGCSIIPSSPCRGRLGHDLQPVWVEIPYRAELLACATEGFSVAWCTAEVWGSCACIPVLSPANLSQIIHLLSVLLCPWFTPSVLSHSPSPNLGHLTCCSCWGGETAGAHELPYQLELFS